LRGRPEGRPASHWKETTAAARRSARGVPQAGLRGRIVSRFPPTAGGITNIQRPGYRTAEPSDSPPRASRYATPAAAARSRLYRYLAEYDFRYSHRVKLGFNDTDRAAIAVKQASGKHLTYRCTR